MKAVIQRVTKASVMVDDEVISSIGRGLCVLIGISKDDTAIDLEYITNKILRIKLFEGENNKKFAVSVQDRGFEILCVSQITLSACLRKNKLDFHKAMDPGASETMYTMLLEALRNQYVPGLVKGGRFGAYMTVNIENDGPVTIELESPPERTKGNKPLPFELQ